MGLNVTLYGKPDCPHCRMAKEYLTERGVAYRERDVVNDPAALQEVQRLGAPGVPVIVIDEQAVLGFDKIRLDDLLKSHQPREALAIKAP